MNIKKSIVFLYTKNELCEKVIKKIISFKMLSKRMKYVIINFNKDVKTYTLKTIKH